MATCLLAAGLTLQGPTPARADEAPVAVVLPASSSAALRPLEEGFADWIEQRLRAAGVPVRDGQQARAALAQARFAAGEEPFGTRELLGIAGDLDAANAVLVDLSFEAGRVDVLMRVHASDRGSLLGAGRSAGPATAMSASATVALERILPVLGLEDAKTAVAVPFEIGALPARSRALRLLDAGELAAAWLEVRDDTSPDAALLRERIALAAESGEIARDERVRLMALRGQADDAWREILRDASENLYAATPDPVILRTAGEIQLERGKLHEAQAYYERAVEVSPDDPDAHLGLGRARAGQLDPRGARQAYARAAELDPTSPHPVELTADVQTENARAAAQAHLAAAEQSRRQLDPRGAVQHIEEAIALDPTLAPDAYEEAGGIRLEYGDHAAAMQSYRAAIDQGGSTLDRQRGLARSLRELDDAAGAEIAYKEALELSRNDPVTLQELGELYEENERHGEARQLLEQAVSLAPKNADARRSLAHTLREQGELEEAQQRLEEADEIAGPDVEGLRELAAIQRALQGPEAASKTLERAVALEPTSVAVREELASAYREQGREQDAARQLELVNMLGGTEALAETRQRPLPSQGQPKDGPSRQLDALVTSFGLPMPGEDRAVLLGLREAHDWRSRLMDWIWPWTLDRELLESRLGAAVDPHYDRIRAPILDAFVADQAEQLFAFGEDNALDAGLISSVNASLQSQTSFVAVVQRGTPISPALCPDSSQLHMELRRLSGDKITGVSILANQACLAEGVSAFSTWNYKAAGVLGALVLLVLFPFLRGFGRVVVHVNLPDNTTALFSVSLTRRPRKITTTKREKKDDDAKGRFNQKLRSMGKKERPLRPGRDIVFGWIPARSAEYYVTVHGPLYHSISEQLIGDFLEERTVQVRRGRSATVQFDMKPKDCPVEIMVYMGNDAVNGAQVARQGDRSASRYTSKGSAFLYLMKGSHIIVAGHGDRVAEREIRIDSFDPMPIVIDLAAEGGLVFQRCPDAVAPFMEEDYELAARALEAAGQPETARMLRVRAHQQRGEVEEASRLLEQSGQLTQAADLLAETQLDGTQSAALYEEAGEFVRAAEIHRASGDMVAAARAYESGYDYANAIECYQQLGDDEKLVELLEKTAENFEAGKLARELGQTGRAIKNLQLVEKRHAFYSEACRELGVLLADQGSADFALEKLDEAKGVGGLDSFPNELLDRYGSLLEEQGRIEDAVEVLSALRRKDVSYANVDARIQALKQQATDLQATRVTGSAGATAATGGAGAPSPALSTRYEILGQLGAGGMGVVYKAKDKHLGRLVALKKLPDNLTAHPAAVKFFEREARSAAALNHPNIVTVFDAGQENGHYFITMEMLEGTPLDGIVKKHGALPPLVVAQLGVQIATGLHFAHHNKIIHRDIKTANLFLTRDKIVKIMDFGLAKMVEEVRKGATVIGGTPYFMAPEQGDGSEVDHRADLYALGITLFQLSTGTLPFTEGDVAYAHRHTPPPDPRELNTELPAILAELILRLIQKRPDDRLQSAAEVVRVLQGMLDAASPEQTQP